MMKTRSKKAPKSPYCVNIDMKWSFDIHLTATSSSEAQRLAWEKFKKNPPRDLFELLADKDT